jgi:hypothetical protein
MDGAEPEQWLKDIADRVSYLRGRYLTSFSQCEFLLADLSVRVDNRFRYALEKRVSAARTMANGDGLLNKYQADFVPLLDHLIEWTERRHWLAHGFMEILHDRKGHHAIRFRRYIQEKEGSSRLAFWTITVPDLENTVSAINFYCIAFVRLCSRIYLEQGLEENESDNSACLTTQHR